MNKPASWRTPYLLLVSLLLPMCTAVLSVYYLTRISPSDGGNGGWACTLTVLSGGLSAVIAVLLSVSLMIVYRQRNRLDRLYRKQNSYLGDVLDERLRMAKNLDILNATHQVTLAMKQENSFERIASVVLEQIEFCSRADDIVVFACSADNELQPRARRLRGINSFGAEIVTDRLDMDVAYEAILAGRLQRHFDEEGGSYDAAIPYSTPDGIRGVLAIRCNTADDPDFINELRFFEASLQLLVKSVSVGLKFAALWDRAIKDEMTGLFNKNHFNKEVPRLLSVALKNQSPLCLLMLDIDKFKHVNDTWGHMAGDLILRQTAAILQENLRDTDMVFRFGGEELCIVCCETVEADAAQYAERLRSRIAHTEFRTELGDLIPVSASFGVAEFDPAAMKGEEDLKQACDKALYYAKEHGRNAVVVARGTDGFDMLERTGDADEEVKHRLGLAGDYSPLPRDDVGEERRADPKPGKIGKRGKRNRGKMDAAAKAATNERVHDTVISPAESIRKLAREIFAAASDDSERLLQVAKVAEEAASVMRQSRQDPENKDCLEGNGTLELGVAHDRTDNDGAPAHAAATPDRIVPNKKSANKCKAADRRKQAGDAAAASTPERRRAKPRRVGGAVRSTLDADKSADKSDAALVPRPTPVPMLPARQSARLKAIEAHAQAQREASDESDRLDFVTEDEAAALLEGQAPKKSARGKRVERGGAGDGGRDGTSSQSSDEWKPRKHW